MDRLYQDRCLMIRNGSAGAGPGAAVSSTPTPRSPNVPTSRVTATPSSVPSSELSRERRRRRDAGSASSPSTSGSSTFTFPRRSGRWLLLSLLTVSLLVFVWRTHKLTQRMPDHDFFFNDPSLHGGVSETERIMRRYGENDRITQEVMAHLSPGGVFNATTFVVDRSLPSISPMLTVVVPARGRLLPLGHMTATSFCSTLHHTQRVEFIFPVTTKLNLDDAKRMLPIQKWKTLVSSSSGGGGGGTATTSPSSSSSGGGISLGKGAVRISSALEADDAALVGIAPCVSRIVIAQVVSTTNGLADFLDPLDKMLSMAANLTSVPSDEDSVSGAGSFNVVSRSVVPLGQLVLAALYLSSPQASHFVLMSEAYIPYQHPYTAPSSFLDLLLAPFTLTLPDGDTTVIPVAVQCTSLQPTVWSPIDYTSLQRSLTAAEDVETAAPSGLVKGSDSRSRRQKKKTEPKPRFELQPAAFERHRYQNISSLRLTVNELSVVDKGVDSGTGVDRQFTTPYCIRRLSGFPASDRRVTEVSQVDMVGPYCTAYHRNAFLLAGGLHNDGSSIFASRILAGMFNLEIRSRVLTLVKVRTTLVERIMESISLVDVHKAGNILRQQVRLAYAEVVESSNLWEDVTGRKYDRTLRDDPFSTRMMEQESAILKAYVDEAPRKVEEKLAFQTARLHEASRELLKLGKNKDSSATEEESGWDLSLRMQRFDRRWRVMVSNATSVFVRERLPGEMVKYFAQNRMPAVHPSYMVDGVFQDRWGKALFAMHRSRGGIPYPESSSMELRERSLGLRPVVVYWSSFCCGCCGFSSEIVHFIYPLSRRRRIHIFNDEQCFCKGYPNAVADTLKRLFMLQEHYLVQYRDPQEISVWISHTDPNSYVQVITEKRKPSYFVGRSMYEFSKIPDLWVRNINEHCDEVWVPCTFVQRVFISSGVAPEKVVIIPEALDTFFYDPEIHSPLALPLSESHPKWRLWENRRLSNPEDYATHYKFYSNFKWEPRKGWDTLLRAYYEAFSPYHRNNAKNTKKTTPPSSSSLSPMVMPKVTLYIQSFYFLNNAVPKGFDIRNVTLILTSIRRWIRDMEDASVFPANTTLEEHFPHIVFVTEHVSEMEQVQLYRTVDAFVLPTRGEGWGLPTIQAMAMGLPTISTNWGGNTEFMTQNTSFLIPIDGLEELPVDSMYYYDEAKKWAIPNLAATREHMRFCAENPDKAREIGRRARQHVTLRFSEEAVADIVDARIEEIRQIVLRRG